jgi:hypothetical protein
MFWVLEKKIRLKEIFRSHFLSHSSIGTGKGLEAADLCQKYF